MSNTTRTPIDQFARATAAAADETGLPSFADALRIWLKIRAAIVRRTLYREVVVDELRWIDEQRFLHALNFCKLLPGPEAQQLAVYLGWLMHGVRGGVAAGTLFVVPS